MPESVQCIVEITSRDGQYDGQLSFGDLRHTRRLTNLQLGPQATVDIKGKAFTLAALVQALIGYQSDDLQTAYDERGQLELGRYLYTQIFGVLNATERRRLRDTSVDVRL